MLYVGRGLQKAAASRPARALMDDTCSFSLPVIGYPSPIDAHTSVKAANLGAAREQCKQLKSCYTASRRLPCLSGVRDGAAQHAII